MVQHFHLAANDDGCGFQIVDNRVGVKTKHAADGQRAVIDQLRVRDRSPEVIQGHRFGECRGIDRDRKRRRQSLQLIGDDDDIIGCRRSGPGFPVRRIAPQPSWRQTFRHRGNPDDGGSIGAGNRHRDALRGACVLRIRHRHRIGEGKRLACGYEIRQIGRQVGKAPVDGAVTRAGTVGRKRRGERRLKFCERARWYCTGSRQHGARQLRGNRVGVGQIDIGK